MKKVSSLTGDVIDFLIAGQRGSRNAVEVQITPEGVIVKDEHALILEQRLGSQISIVNATMKDAKKEIEEKSKAKDVVQEVKDETEEVKQ